MSQIYSFKLSSKTAKFNFTVKTRRGLQYFKFSLQLFSYARITSHDLMHSCSIINNSSFTLCLDHVLCWKNITKTKVLLFGIYSVISCVKTFLVKTETKLQFRLTPFDTILFVANQGNVCNLHLHYNGSISLPSRRNVRASSFPSLSGGNHQCRRSTVPRYVCNLRWRGKSP